MLQFFRRLTALFSAGALLLTLSACGNKKDDAAAQLAMTVNGHAVDAGTYAAVYLYGEKNLESMMYQYGVTDLWESEIGASYKAKLGEIAYKQTAALYLVPEQFEAAGLTLKEESAEDREDINPELSELGFTDELTDQFFRYFEMLDQLEDYYFGENGVMSPGEEEIEQYFQEHYLRAKHILISNQDESGQAVTDETALAVLEQKVQEIYQRAIAGEDFDSLIEEFGEDPGMQSNPDGYQFTDGVMVPEFENATKALGMNEISAPVKTDFGWHIILRLPLRAEDRPTVYGEIVTALTGMDMNSLLDQWVGEAEIKTEPVVDEITFETVENYKYNIK